MSEPLVPIGTTNDGNPSTDNSEIQWEVSDGEADKNDSLNISSFDNVISNRVFEDSVFVNNNDGNKSEEVIVSTQGSLCKGVCDMNMGPKRDMNSFLLEC